MEPSRQLDPKPEAQEEIGLEGQPRDGVLSRVRV